ncbi:hypothetical protein CEXT_641691 [Caerostris extrusa]|uniref:Uncharacterized protein n=1 Tax=Caerostris extrusa TaxID=172846 RepID=A0AAV4SXK3_CAEEX|nr:hypothetical protein CEXT_641691 [Caerostris extrusa]
MANIFGLRSSKVQFGTQFVRVRSSVRKSSSHQNRLPSTLRIGTINLSDGKTIHVIRWPSVEGATSYLFWK